MAGTKRALGPAAWALAMGAFAALAACSRTPPEPSPAASVNTAATPRTDNVTTNAATPSAPRCIAKWPVSGPAIPPPATKCPADNEPNLAKLPAASVSFLDAKLDAKSELRVEAELAKTEHDVTRGLMFRRAMRDDQGMLFKLEDRSDHQFWMENTCIALDMMFIDEDGTIVGIVEGAEPLTRSTRSVGCPSRYVLEVNGGWSRTHGVAPGQKIALPPAIR